jgi:hypothetical protein
MTYRENAWCPFRYCTDEEIAWAKMLRKKRDELYGNAFTFIPESERWAGDLSELKYDQFFEDWKGEFPIVWNVEGNVLVMPDFSFGDLEVGVKSMCRVCPPKRDWEACIAVHIYEQKKHDYWLLTSYEYTKQVMWLCGVAPARILEPSQENKTWRLVKKGEFAHANCQMREDSMMVAYKKCLTLDAWRQELRDGGGK